MKTIQTFVKRNQGDLLKITIEGKHYDVEKLKDAIREALTNGTPPTWIEK